MKDSKSDIIEYSIFILIFTVVFVLATLIFNKLYPVEEELEDLKAEPIIEEPSNEEPQEELLQENVVVIVDQAPEVKKPILTDEDLMARVIYAEAKGEKLIGQVLVAYTILNRCDYYGKTVEAVVKEPNQFSYDENIKPNDSCYRAVIIAEFIKDFIPDLLPDTLMWFRPGDYHRGRNCGKPYIQVGNHYFNYLPESEETE